MPNVLFDTGRNGFLTGLIDWDTDVIKAVLVDHSVVTPLPGTHVFLSDISAGVVSTSAALGSTTGTAGVADSADIAFVAVSGASCESVVLFKDTGVAATSRLIAFMDSGSGLPVTPNGGNINVIWDNGANKIFKL